MLEEKHTLPTFHHTLTALWSGRLLRFLHGALRKWLTALWNGRLLRFLLGNGALRKWLFQLFLFGWVCDLLGRDVQWRVVGILLGLVLRLGLEVVLFLQVSQGEDWGRGRGGGGGGRENTMGRGGDSGGGACTYRSHGTGVVQFHSSDETEASNSSDAT